MPLSTRTEVANLALSRIGTALISSLDSDTSEQARQCRLHFDHKLDSLLRRHQWNFARTRAGLSAIATAPLSEWAKAWQLPEDMVRHIRITATDPHNPILFYAIEGRQLLCNEETAVNILYVSNAKPVNEWDPLFVEALVLLLAAELAGSIAQNPTQRTELLAEFQRMALPAAETADAREDLSGENFGVAQIASQSALVNARYRADGRPPYIPLP